MAASTLASRPISIISMIILARLLEPADFGIVALAMVLFSTARLFSNLGMDGAVVQSQNGPDITAFPAFATAATTSAVFFLTINANIVWFSTILGNVELVPVMRWLSVIILFDAWSTIPEALLRRELRFGKVSRTLIVINTVNSSVAVILAFAGFGLWSLVIANISGSFTRCIMLWMLNPRWVWLRPQWPGFTVYRDLLTFGVRSTSGALVSYVHSHWDDWYVGRTMGATMLGYYDKAYNFTNGTIASLNMTMVSGVFMPSYAKIQNDRARLARVYLKGLGVTAMFMAPMSMGVFAVATDLVPVLFGQKWIPMIPTLRIFAFMALIRPLASSTSPLFRAVGKPQYDLYGGLVVLATMVPMVLYLAPWGIAGVAIAVTISFALGFLFNVVLLGRILPGIAPQIAPVALPSIAASIIMVGVVAMSRPLLIRAGLEPQSLLLLLTLVLIGGIIFVLSGYLLQRSLMHEFADTLTAAIPNQRLQSMLSRKSARV